MLKRDKNTTEWRLLYLHPAVIMPFKISTIMENIAIPFYIKFNRIFWDWWIIIENSCSSILKYYSFPHNSIVLNLRKFETRVQAPFPLEGCQHRCTTLTLFMKKPELTRWVILSWLSFDKRYHRMLRNTLGCHCPDFCSITEE